MGAPIFIPVPRVKALTHPKGVFVPAWATNGKFDRRLEKSLFLEQTESNNAG
jgi:hypothetical protein